jgi:hypothetical protein
VGLGATGRTLAASALRRPDEQLSGWTGVAGEDVLVLLGADLPWTPDAIWLGKDGDLWLPTTQESTVPVELVLAAFRRAGHRGRLAVLPESGHVISLAHARPVARSRLQDWLEGRWE